MLTALLSVCAAAWCVGGRTFIPLCGTSWFESRSTEVLKISSDIVQKYISPHPYHQVDFEISLFGRSHEFSLLVTCGVPRKVRRAGFWPNTPKSTYELVPRIHSNTPLEPKLNSPNWTTKFVQPKSYSKNAKTFVSGSSYWVTKTLSVTWNAEALRSSTPARIGSNVFGLELKPQVSPSSWADLIIAAFTSKKHGERQILTLCRV